MSHPMASSFWMSDFLAFLASVSFAFRATAGAYGLNLFFGAPQTAKGHFEAMKIQYTYLAQWPSCFFCIKWKANYV